MNHYSIPTNIITKNQNPRCVTSVIKYKGKSFANLEIGIDHAYTMIRMGYWNVFSPNIDAIAYLLEKDITNFDDVSSYLKECESHDFTDNPFIMPYYKYGAYLLREDIKYNLTDFINNLVAKKEFNEKYMLDFVKILEKAKFIHHKDYISNNSYERIILRQFKMKDVYIVYYIDYMYEHSIYLVTGDVDSFVEMTLKEEIEVGNEYKVLDIPIIKTKEKY